MSLLNHRALVTRSSLFLRSASTTRRTSKYASRTFRRPIVAMFGRSSGICTSRTDRGMSIKSERRPPSHISLRPNVLSSVGSFREQTARIVERMGLPLSHARVLRAIVASGAVSPTSGCLSSIMLKAVLLAAHSPAFAQTATKSSRVTATGPENRAGAVRANKPLQPTRGRLLARG